MQDLERRASIAMSIHNSNHDGEEFLANLDTMHDIKNVLANLQKEV